MVNPIVSAVMQLKASVPTETWRDLAAGEHLSAFMIAGASNEMMLDELRTAIDASGSQDEFRRQFVSIAERYGWNYTGDPLWRTDIIYGTNINQAVRAGRWQQMTDPDVLKSRPYWQITEGEAQFDPRPDHKALEGKVYPAMHEFWNTHFFPVGFGCTHRVMSVSGADLAREGLTVDEPPAIGDDVGGVTLGVEPGWSDQPPALSTEDRIKSLNAIAERLSEPAQERLTRYIEDLQQPLTRGDAEMFILELFEALGYEPTPDELDTVIARARNMTRPELAAAIWDTFDD